MIIQRETLVIVFLVFLTFTCVGVDAGVRIQRNDFLPLDEIEHVHDFELTHHDTRARIEPYSKVSSDPSHERVYTHGLHTPYPRKLRVSFTSHGEKFVLPLTLMDQLYEPHSYTEIRNGNDELIQKVPNRLSTYHYANEDDWAVVTVHDDGLIQATILRDGITTQIHPAHLLAKDLDKESAESVLSSSKTGLVSFQHQDLDGTEQTHKCGAVDADADADTNTNSNIKATTAEAEAELHTEDSDSDIRITSSSSSSSSSSKKGMRVRVSGVDRHLLQFPTSSARWQNCYPGQPTQYKISTGVVIDAGMYAQYGSQTGATNYMNQQFGSSNQVYLNQLGIFLAITDVIVYTSAGSPAFNSKFPPTLGTACSGYDMGTQLNQFTAWRQSTYPFRNGIWHLLTNCFPPPGVVGLSWVGTLCNSNYATSIASYSYLNFVTTAHEIGHSFGAQHTFQNGQGTTGGLMDYCDGKLPCYSGIYQFSAQYSQSQICTTITNSLSVSGFSPYCFAPYSSSYCGNGVVDAGEQCDDTSSCCTSSCTFASGAVCSSSTAGSCCSSCQFSPPSTSCSNGNGYCANGQCVTSSCISSGMSFCGTVSGNNCRQRCVSSTGVCNDNYVSPNLNIANGVYCGGGTYCTSGYCPAQGKPTSAPTVPPTPPPPSYTYRWAVTNYGACSCTGTQTGTLTCIRSDGVTVANSYCTSSSPSTTQQCTIPSGCLSWWQSGWSSCNAPLCGTGTQTQTVNCVITGTTTVVSSSLCTGTQPPTVQACSNNAGCNAAWTYGPWSSCSAACGGGTQTRTATCMSGNTALLASACGGTGSSGSSIGYSYLGCFTDASSRALRYTLSTDASMTPATCGSLAKAAGYAYFGIEYSHECYGDNSGYNQFGTSSACTMPCGGDSTQICGGSWALSVYSVTSTSSASSSTAAVTQQACNTQACAPTTYTWVAGTFGSCTASCGGGTQTRSNTCKDNNGNVVSNTYCTNALGALATIQTCNTQSCATYSWYQSGWSSCTATCGGGTQTQTVYCLASTGGVVGDSYCSTTKPATLQLCNLQACTVATWSTGAWSSCSVSCGGGTSTRSVTCSNPGSCSQPAPVSAQSCNAQACGAYSWTTGDWRSCSTSCGGGWQSRQVSCTITGSQTPTMWQQCGASSTPSNVVSLGCFADGGSPAGSTGARAFGVSLTNGVNPMTPAECARLASAAGYMFFGLQYGQECWADNSPSSFNKFGVSSSCNMPCGGDKSVMCGGSWANSVYSLQVTSSGSVPVAAQTCNTNSCPFIAHDASTPKWIIGEWSDCSQVCDGGIRERNITCANDNGQVFPDSSCAGVVKPATNSTCSMTSCPTYWWTGSFGQCNRQCGGGTQIRVVECRAVDDPYNYALDDTKCTGTKPASMAPCNIQACPVWVPGPWSVCSARCGDGSMTRSLSCTNYKGVILSDQMCFNSPVVATSAPCSLMPCPHWHADDWSSCSRECSLSGVAGTQNRTLSCRMPHDDTYNGAYVDASLCDAVVQNYDTTQTQGVLTLGKPSLTQQCNIQPCGDYYWQLTSISPCSVSCGGGVAKQQFSCVRSSDGSVVPDKTCPDEKPFDLVTCNLDPCPAYKWIGLNDWTNCSVECGVGTQTQTVKCVNVNPSLNDGVNAQQVDNANCTQTGQKPPDSTRICSVPVSVCSTLSNGRFTGRCLSGSCECRSDFGGDHCDVALSLRSASIDAATYQQGIPLGESVVITWTAAPEVPYVSLLLLRKSSLNWLQAQYFATLIPNTGSYLWNVGSSLTDLEWANDYFVRVYYQDNIYADTAVFSISNPCAYKNCGLHGRCDRGVCSCTANYTGDSCGISPCTKAKCNADYSTCNNLDYLLNGSQKQCPCKDGWSGSQCSTPPGCIPKCKNGADYVRSVITVNGTVESCGVCSCLNQWTGADCSNCPLQCMNGGTPDPTCSVCLCGSGSGFWGSQCQCPYYQITMRVFTDDTSDSWLSDPVAVARFKRSFATDVAIAAGLATTTDLIITVDAVASDGTVNGKHALLVSIRLSKECHALSSGSISEVDTLESTDVLGIKIQISSNALVGSIVNTAAYPGNRNIHTNSMKSNKAARMTPMAVVDNNALLLSAWQSLLSTFQNVDSPLYHGVITYNIDRSYQITVSDPSGRSQPPNPSLSNDPFMVTPGDARGTATSVSTIVGIVVGCTGFVVLLVCSFLAYRRYQAVAATRAKQKALDIGMTTDMTSIATARVGTPKGVSRPSQVQSQSQTQLSEAAEPVVPSVNEGERRSISYPSRIQVPPRSTPLLNENAASTLAQSAISPSPDDILSPSYMEIRSPSPPPDVNYDTAKLQQALQQ